MAGCEHNSLDTFWGLGISITIAALLSHPFSIIRLVSLRLVYFLAKEDHWLTEEPRREQIPSASKHTGHLLVGPA